MARFRCRFWLKCSITLVSLVADYDPFSDSAFASPWHHLPGRWNRSGFCSFPRFPMGFTPIHSQRRMPWSVYPIWIGQRIDPQSQLQFLVALHNSPIAADENQSRQKKRQERKISPHIIPRLIAAIAANLPQMCSKTGPVHPGRGLQKTRDPEAEDPVLCLRDCKGGVAGPRGGREALRALLRERCAGGCTGGGFRMTVPLALNAPSHLHNFMGYCLLQSAEFSYLCFSQHSVCITELN